VRFFVAMFAVELIVKRRPIFPLDDF